MKILLLGSNGQLGYDIHRINQLNPNPFEFISLTRNELDVSQIENIHTKLSNIPFDVLINCTSFHNTDQVEKNPNLAFTINAFAVKEMSKICKEKNALFIHISTDYVFRDSAHRKPLQELDSPGPLNIYGASKLMGESLAFAVNENILIFRVASLFGVAGASGKGGNFVETMIRLGKEKRKLNIIADQIMSPTSTADLANMILSSIKKGIPAGIYHAVNTGAISWYEFAKAIIEQSNTKAIVEPIPAIAYPSVVTRPRYSALNNQKLENLIGKIKPWEEALHSYLIEKNYKT